MIAAGAPARSPGDARHGRRLVSPRPAGARPARARARLPRARARRAAVRLRPRAAGRALSLARRARPGCSAAWRRSTASCAPAAGAWCSATGARRPRCAGSRPRSARAPCTSPTTSRASRGPRRARGAGARARRRAAHPPPGPLRRRPARDPDHGRRALHGLLALPARVEGAGAPPRRARAARDRDAAHRRGPAAVAARARLRRGAPRLDERPEPGEDAARRAARSWVEGPGLGALRGAPRRARRADLAPVGLPALRLPRRRSSSSARVAARGGARYRDQLAWRDFYAAVQLHFPARRAHRAPGALPRPRVGRRRRAARGLARGPDRLSPSSTPRCASSPRPAGCTTARA